MICFVKLNVGVGGAEMPLAPVSVFAGSAATFVIEGVPAANGVSLSVVNAAGATMTVRARRNPGRRSEWAATFPAAHMAAAGRTERGVTVAAFGVDACGESVTWILGVGDIVFVPVDAAVTENLGAYTNIRLLEAELETPHRGDLVKRDGVWSLYNGTSWEAIDAVKSVNGRVGDVRISASDVGAVNQIRGSANYLSVHGGLDLYAYLSFYTGKDFLAMLVFEGGRFKAHLADDTSQFLAWKSEIPTEAKDVHAAAEDHSHFAKDINDLKAVIGQYGNILFAGKSHTHFAYEINDMSYATRYELTETYKDGGTITLGANMTTYVKLGGAAFTGNINIEASRDKLEGRVTDFVLVIMAEKDTTILYDSWGGSVLWLSADPDGVKTVKAHTPTMLYFTEIKPPDEPGQGDHTSAIYAIGKTELQEVT